MSLPRFRIRVLLVSSLVASGCSGLYGQLGSVSGRVALRDGDAVEFANVALLGTTRGTTTAPDGSFALADVAEGTYTLAVSSVGYGTLEREIDVRAGERTVVAALTLRDSAAGLDAVAVVGTRRQGYLVEETYALGVPLPIAEAPASVSVLSDALLEDLGARTLGAFVTYVPGIANADNGGTNRENFIVRGFPQTQTFVNGLRQSITSEGIRAVETVERVQILKGPSGVEASLTSPGGFVDIVTKKPEGEFAAEAFAGVGDYNFLRVGGDVTGPLVAGKLDGRVIAAYQQKPFWRDGRQRRPVVTLAPSLAYQIAPGTKAVAEYEFSAQNDPLDRGVTYLRGAGLEGDFLPRTFSFHGEGDALETVNHRLFLSLDHRFGPRLRGRVRYQRATQTSEEGAFRNADSEGDGSLYADDGLTYSGDPVIDVFYADFGADLESDNVHVDLTGEFATGRSEHTLNVGGSFARNLDLFRDDDSDFVYGDYVNTLNVFAPDNAQSPELAGTDVFPNFRRGDEIVGGFAQLVTRWTPRLRTVASFRYDEVEVFAADDLDGIGAEARRTLEADAGPDGFAPFSETYGEGLASYRLGGSYDLAEGLAAFVGYAATGEPQAGFTRAGDAIAPIRASSVEAGLKYGLFGGRALATATAYYLEREDIAVADPSNDDQESFLLPLGTAEVRGAELELTGKVNASLSVFGGLSFQDSEITASDDPIVGNRFANVPRFQYSAFANYNADPLGLAALDVSAGVVHQGEREANSANEYQLPGYTRVDLAVGFTFRPRLELRANVQNVLDATYYLAAQDSIFGADQVAVGNRRLLQLTLTKRW